MIGGASRACGPAPSTRRRHPPVGVGRQPAFRLVQQNHFVAEWVANARASANRDVERRLHGLTAGLQEGGESRVRILNDNIGFGANVEVNDELRVCFGERKADGFVGSPQDRMPETIAIEGNRCIKVGDAKQEVVELTKQRPADAHA